MLNLTTTKRCEAVGRRAASAVAQTSKYRQKRIRKSLSMDLIVSLTMTANYVDGHRSTGAIQQLEAEEDAE